MTLRSQKRLLAAIGSGLALILAVACGKSSNDSAEDIIAAAAPRYLYVASGLCQAGANTTFTSTSASQIVYRVNTSTGARDMTLADYNVVAESPVGLVDFDNGNILVAVEKAGARRIEKVEKKVNGARSNFNTDTVALANVLLGMARRPDGGLYVSRTNGVALISNSGTTQVSSYIAGTSGNATCGTANTKYSAVLSTSQGHLVYLNSKANDNKVSIVRSGPTCLAGTTPANAAAVMTTAVWIPGAKQIIAAVSNTTTTADQNALYVYDVTEDATTASMGAATKIYDLNLYPGTYPFQLYAVSAMAYDEADNSLYIATSNQVAANIPTAGALYQIEKFKYDSTAKTLTRVGSVPFYPPSVDTKCISSMIVAK